MSHSLRSLAIPKSGLILFRSALAAICLLDCLLRLRDLTLLYSDLGVLPRSSLHLLLSDQHVFNPALTSGHPVLMGMLLLTMVGLALAVLWGRDSSWILAGLWLGMVFVQERNPLVNEGSDHLLRMFLFGSIFLPSKSDYQGSRYLAFGTLGLQTHIMFALTAVAVGLGFGEPLARILLILFLIVALGFWIPKVRRVLALGALLALGLYGIFFDLYLAAVLAAAVVVYLPQQSTPDQVHCSPAVNSLLEKSEPVAMSTKVFSIVLPVVLLWSGLVMVLSSIPETRDTAYSFNSTLRSFYLDSRLEAGRGDSKQPATRVLTVVSVDSGEVLLRLSTDDGRRVRLFLTRILEYPELLSRMATSVALAAKTPGRIEVWLETSPENSGDVAQRPERYLLASTNVVLTQKR